MKTMDMLICKEGIAWSAERKDMDGVEVTTAMLKDVALSYGQSGKGLTESDRRMFYKVCDKFDALNEIRSKGGEETTIEFEDAEMGFIRKVFKENTQLIPSDYVRRVEERVWEVENR